MVLKKDNIGQTFLLPLDIRTMIPDNHVCFFVEKLVNCADFSDVDFEFMDTPGQKAYPAALLIRIIVLGMIYGIHTSRKLERIVRENIVFMYIAGFDTPVFSTIASFKRKHQDLIEKVFLETIDYGHNKDLIDLDSISLDGSKTRAYANKYNNLTEEDVQKLLHIIEQGIILDEEENQALENRENKILDAGDVAKEQIKKALRESKNIQVKGKKKQRKTKKLQKEDKERKNQKSNSKKGNSNKESSNKESSKKVKAKSKKEDEEQKTIDYFRKRPMKEAMRTNPEKYDDEMYKLIDENDLNLCGKKILRQAIEKPETAYKQVNKLEKCKKMLEKTGDNTANYTDPEARKSPSKEGIMQPGYNEQIMADNKNGLIIAVDVTTAGNDNVQLKPMIQKTEETLSKALGLTIEESKEILNGTKLLADYGYFNYEGVDFTENETKMTLYMPDKEKASKDKDKLRRPSQRKKKKERYGKYDMTWDEENKYYICPEGEKLEMKKIYHKEYKDVIVYYGTGCAKCPSRQKCLTEKMTTKVITDYASESTDKLRYRMQTNEAQDIYKDRMPNAESKFAHNKYNLNYRQYHIIGQEKALTQQLLMATAQNIIKIHNIEQQQIIENQNKIPV